MILATTVFKVLLSLLGISQWVELIKIPALSSSRDAEAGVLQA
jgi:hypothetical protein